MRNSSASDGLGGRGVSSGHVVGGSEHFKDACALSGAHTHRDDAVLGALGFQFVEKLHSELGSGATEGVSKGDGSRRGR